MTNIPKKYNCFCDSNSIEDSDFRKLKVVLPEGYEYKLCSYEEQKIGFLATLRLALGTQDEAVEWWKAFQETSTTTLRVSKTYPRARCRNVYRVDFRCQHKTRTPRKSTNAPHKNTGCEATLSIIVKRIERDRRVRSKDTHLFDHPMIVNMKFIHNHPIISPDVLCFRDVPKEVREKFIRLFQIGHSPSSALDIHKMDIQVENQDDDLLFIMADRAQVPDYAWCYRLYYNYYGTSFGKRKDKLNEALAATIEELNQEHDEPIIKMAQVEENQVIIAICTPLMKRILQHVDQSGEMCFVDSFGMMDHEKSRIFLIMTQSYAGGLPIGCFITTRVTEATVTDALNLYLTLIPNNGFGGRGKVGPLIFMTGDCEVERNALRNVFPESVLFLCTLRVLQATWRWLWNEKNEIKLADRQDLFRKTKSLLYAKTPALLDELYVNALYDEKVESYPDFAKYIEWVYMRRGLWAVCYQDGLTIQDNKSNNFCEAAMKVLSDKVLLRTKSFNTLQLVDFLVTRHENYYERRLIDFASNHIDNIRHSKYLSASKMPIDVSRLSDHIFVAKSETEENEVFHIDMEIGMCTCDMGNTGGVCKHQAAVYKNYKVECMNVKPVKSSKQRCQMYYLATGKDNAPDIDENCTWDSDDSNVDILISVPGDGPDIIVDSTNSLDNETDANNTKVSQSENIVKYDFALQNSGHNMFYKSVVSEVKKKLLSYAESLAEKLENDPETYLPAVTKFVTRGEKLSTDSATVSALMTFGKCSNPSEKKNLKKNGVQPTGSVQCINFPVSSDSSAKRSADQGLSRRTTVKIESGVVPKKRKTDPDIV